MKVAMRIYFAGSIRGGRDDVQLYIKIIKQLQRYGTVLTEHVADPNLESCGKKKEILAGGGGGSGLVKDNFCL